MMRATLSALSLALISVPGCSEPSTTTSVTAPTTAGKADGASCPADVGLTANNSQGRRCYDTNNGQFVASECCEDICEGAGIRHQANGDRCAWITDPGMPGAVRGRFAPRFCCDLNESLACGRAEPAGGGCIDPLNGAAVDDMCCDAVPLECHPVVASALRTCVSDANADAQNEGLPLPTLLATFDACGGELDALAAQLEQSCEYQPNLPFCGLDFEAVVSDFVDPCVEQERPDYDCSLGATFFDTADQAHIAMVERTTFDLAGAQTAPAYTQAQIIAAVSASGLSVDALDEAFAAADGQEVNRVELYDLSTRTGYTAIEFGAGDTSVGSIFTSRTSQSVATINDGDLSRPSETALGCNAPIGEGGNLCSNNDDCATGFRCEGRTSDPNPISTPLGLCVDVSVPAPWNDCTSHESCDEGYCVGLVAYGGNGFCGAGWMFGERESDDVVAPADGANDRSDVLIYGQASVPMDLQLTLDIFHDVDVDDLTVELLIPGYEGGSDDDRPRVTVWPNDQVDAPHITGGRVTVPVFAFGDESINGTWTIIVTDANADGSTGGVYGWSLGYSSRWD